LKSEKGVGTGMGEDDKDDNDDNNGDDYDDDEKRVKTGFSES
jgi:hypothetical protein